jgi:hypothetical protein
LPFGAATSPSSSAASEALGRSFELLAQVRAGTVSGKLLAPSDRQAVVGLLCADGLSAPEIAQILQVADRTVERDRRAIRESLAVARDPKLVEQMVGRLMAEAELCVQRIRRTARDREVDPAVKVDAEHRCFEIIRDLVGSLQRLGYLPSATQKVEADLTHHVGDLGNLPTLNDLQSEIDRLKLVAGGQPNQLLEAEEVIARAAVATSVREVVATVEATSRAAEQEEPDADQP